jgi:long-chain acyl-CoA synthetase
MPYPDSTLRSAVELFYQWEATKPDAPFLQQPFGEEWKTISWGEAGQIARKVAAALRKMGYQPGDHIGMVSKNCYHWVLADLAMMIGGYVSVPFYPTLSASQLEEVIRLGDIKAIFVGKLDNWELMKEGVPADIPIIAFPHYPGNSKVAEGLQWDEWIADTEPLAENPAPDIHALWTILFTSGTTGTPKGVMLDYYAPTALMEMERQHNILKLFHGDEHRFFSYLPLNHIAERIIVELACLLTGGTIYFAESLDRFAQNLRYTKPTLFMAVPRIWTKFQLGILERLPQKKLDFFLKIPILSGLIKKKIITGLGLDKANILLTGAAPTPDVLKEWYKSIGIVIQEVYAQTENCGGCTLMPFARVKSGTVGVALPDVEIRIDPDNGEVVTRSPWTMMGYYKAEDKTKEVLREGWLYSGDQGELDAEGYLRITGRVADTFKSAKGKFIVPAPIEWGFAKNSFIEQICIVGLTLPPTCGARRAVGNRQTIGPQKRFKKSTRQLKRSEYRSG